MTTVSINEKFTLQFVCKESEAKKHQEAFELLGIKYFADKVTKERMGNEYPVASGRPEIVFDLPNLRLEEAVHIKYLIQKIN